VWLKNNHSPPPPRISLRNIGVKRDRRTLFVKKKGDLGGNGRARSLPLHPGRSAEDQKRKCWQGNQFLHGPLKLNLRAKRTFVPGKRKKTKKRKVRLGTP